MDGNNAQQARIEQQISSTLAESEHSTTAHDDGFPAAAAAEQRSRVRGGAAQADVAAGDTGASAEGGCLSNTHLQSSQFEIDGFPDYRFAGGLDWFEFTSAIDWNPVCFADFAMDLRAVKERLQSGRRSSTWIDVRHVGPIRVWRTGFNRGGDRGQHFPFKISFAGIEIGVGNRQCGNEKSPNMVVRLTGRDCLRLGAREAYDGTRKFIAAMGGKVLLEKLSRADLTLDIVGMPVDELQIPVEKRRFISWASGVHPQGNMVGRGRRTGFHAGKYPLHLTVYDKIAKHFGRADELYCQALIDRRWGGKVPDHATRIEFQVSRPRLKDYGIGSPDDFFRLQGSVVEDLTHDWFRLTTKRVDRRNHNQSRAETLPAWKAVQKAYAIVYGQPSGPLVPLQREKVNPIKLVKMALGCLINGSLQSGKKVETFDELLYAGIELFCKAVPTAEAREKVVAEYRRRATEFLA